MIAKSAVTYDRFQVRLTMNHLSSCQGFSVIDRSLRVESSISNQFLPIFLSSHLSFLLSSFLSAFLPFFLSSFLPFLLPTSFPFLGDPNHLFTGCVRWLVGRVVYSFDDPHGAPYWPTQPCFKWNQLSQWFHWFCFDLYQRIVETKWFIL